MDRALNDFFPFLQTYRTNNASDLWSKKIYQNESTSQEYSVIDF